MVDKLQNLFRREAESRDREERRKGLRVTLLAAMPVAILFSGINFFEDHRWLAAVLIGVTLLLLLPSYLLAASNRFLILSEYLLMSASVIIFGALFVDGGLSETGVYWIYIYPFVAFYIMGQNRGWLWVSFFGLFLLLSIGLHLSGGITLPYAEDRLKFFLTAFIFYILIAYIFNRLRNNFEQKLTALVDERTRVAESYLEELKLKVMHSPVTGLPNLPLLIDRFEQALHVAKRNNSGIAIAAISIDNLTEINNVLGHKTGDDVLKHVAKSLELSVRDMDTVAHIGSAEFAVVMPTISASQVESASRRVMSVFKVPIEVADTSLVIDGHIGFSIYPDHGGDARALLQHADAAMRVAKREKSQFKIYDASFDPFKLRHLEMFRDLKRAIKEEQLELYYQPQIDLKSGNTVSAEALMRWNHSEEGLVSPGEFIPLAEQTGLITKMSRWAVAKAIAQCAQWQQSGNRVGVSVNLSMRCLMAPDMLEQIADHLASHALSPQSLTIEVTESLFMEQSGQVISLLSQLRDMGVSIAIDDFGTGYSSLSYLKKLPVDELKIDQAFIFPISESRQDQMIVLAVVQLAESMGFEVLAEGVEDGATGQILKELGVNRVQGFHYARPMPCDHFRLWMGEAPDSINKQQSDKP